MEEILAAKFTKDFVALKTDAVCETAVGLAEPTAKSGLNKQQFLMAVDFV